MTCGEAPAAARLWGAVSPTRDFRKAKWESNDMTAEGAAFAGKADRPASGFLALFGEADFQENGKPFSLSTTVRIVEAGK
jgi:PhoPQ-activated pathogenicity-related protein